MREFDQQMAIFQEWMSQAGEYDAAAKREHVRGWFALFSGCNLTPEQDQMVRKIARDELGENWFESLSDLGAGARPSDLLCAWEPEYKRQQRDKRKQRIKQTGQRFMERVRNRLGGN